MRLAILSDIHGNLPALTTALEHIDRSQVDEIICLGDIVGYGANPVECVDLIRKRCVVSLLGNHDAAAVDPQEAEGFTDRARVAATWTRRQLQAADQEFLRTLPYTASRHGLLFVHASPCRPDLWEYIVTPEDAQEAFRCFAESVCFVGHSHMPGIYSERGRERGTQRGTRFVINVGSVGQPRDGDPRLSFGLFDTDGFEFRNVRLAYDTAEAAQRILKAGLPRSLADRLAVGI